MLQSAVGQGTAGFVLVGGRSSRLGTDKALLDWEGKALALHIAGRVRDAAGGVALVGDPLKYLKLGLPVIADTMEGAGPLGGVAAVLSRSEAEWNLVLACDMPYATTEFLRFLLAQAQRPGNDFVDARGRGAEVLDIVLPYDRQGRAEPLCAVYATRCGGALSAALKRGVRKMTDAFAGLRVRALTSDAYAAFDPQGLLLANLNNPADLARLEQARASAGLAS